MSKVLFLLVSITASTAYALPALAYQCRTTQAGAPVNIRDLCGTIDAEGTFSDGSSIYGTNSLISRELKQFADGVTTVCVDACAVEGDLQVYKIVSAQ